MKPRINIITLAVDDLQKSLAFYQEGLGLPTKGIAEGHDDHVLFELQGGLSLVLFLRSEVAKLTGQSEAVKSSTECMLSYPAGSKGEVDDVLRRAREAGATLLGEVQDESWGYVGHFKDLDGHVWEIIWNPGFITD
jgi:uncharacterized protein